MAAAPIRFPYSRQQVTEADVAAVASVLRGRMLTQGPAVEEFERALGLALGGPEVVACANGTAALHLAYLALGLGPDRGIVTSPITFLATANAARMAGAPVWFADVDPDTGNLDSVSVREALRGAGGRAAAIVPVHLAGRPCDMEALGAVAREFGCAIVEDACHALGAHYPGRPDAPVGGGTAATLACFSFHAVKHVAMGEGGAVATRDPALARRMRLLRSHGMERDAAAWVAPPEADPPWYYEMAEYGYNYRLTDIQAALGTSQLGRLGESLAARRAIAVRYDAALADVPAFEIPRRAQEPRAHAWHLYPLAVDFAAIGKTRGRVMRELASAGIGTQVHYIPLYRQPYYAADHRGPLPGAERYYQRTLSIPMYPQLTAADQADIVAALREVCRA